jgi:radical SAM superfamily enzyme YgiQ (UPF0313 family)
MSDRTRDILLVAINARYSHTSLGIRFLIANVDVETRSRTELLEFSINDDVVAIMASIFKLKPRLIGLGVYIWNRRLVEELVPLLRESLPALRIVLGGPEIAYDVDSDLAQHADCVVCGEGEPHWQNICQDMLAGKVIRSRYERLESSLDMLNMPDVFYSESDFKNRNIYIEASRGCPLACTFCLSSVEAGVRHFPEHKVCESLQRLLDRGALQYRFVDRSFNLAGKRAERLLQFFLDRMRPGLRLHFEMTPDGLSARLRQLLQAFPPGVLHIEAGIQSFDPTVLARVNRRVNISRAVEGIDWLVREAKADVHADLIAGLPGETLSGFMAGFDRLYALAPSEIQVGVLKRLHGTLVAEDGQGARFRNVAPYDVLETPCLSANELDGIRRFAAHWDRVVNRGHFPLSIQRLLAETESAWQCFDSLSQTLASRYGLYGIGLVELSGAILDALLDGGVAESEAKALVRSDYLDGGRRQHLPAFLRD